MGEKVKGEMVKGEKVKGETGRAIRHPIFDIRHLTSKI
jgi:hypothetical protein